MAEPSVSELSQIRDLVSPEEWAVREDLAAAYRLVAHFGWDDLIFTHLSARVPGPEHHFLINPFGYLFEEVTASSLVKIDIDGNIVLDNGFTANAAGFTIHSAIHMAREDAQSVMHLHTDAGQAVSAMADGLLPLNQTALFSESGLAYHEYEGVAFNLDERPRLIADLGDKHAMLLWNHGTLTLGASVAECFLRMYFLERACQAQVLTLGAGRELHLPSEQAMEATRALTRTPEGAGAIGALAWPALIRMLDRRDRGFRD